MRIAELGLLKVRSVFSYILYFEHSDASPTFEQLIRYDGSALIRLSGQEHTLIYLRSNMNKAGRVAVISEFIEDNWIHRDLAYNRYWRDQEFESKTTIPALKPDTSRERRSVEVRYEIGTPLSNDISIVLNERIEAEGFLGPPFLMLPCIP